MSSTPAGEQQNPLLERVLTEIGLPAAPMLSAPPHPVALPSRLATGDLAWASVAAVCTAAGVRAIPDPDRIALSYRSDRLLTIDGVAPPVWSPCSGFWRTQDGWVRTHGNYPHHAGGLLRGLHVDDAAHIGAALSERTSAEAVAAIVSAGGLAVTVSPEDPGRDARLRHAPLLDVTQTGLEIDRPDRAPGSGDLPLTGIRVLDLTRVIAGPVCTRTLALLGADVLRVDPPQLPEPEWQHLDTGHGKRTALLDARSPDMQELLSAADVVVLGYRPAALARLGLSPDDLAAAHPGRIIATLSAWGDEQPQRAGFDSLVQAESGIALVETPDGERPGVLPAQALDHSAGYLLAASVIALVERRRQTGCGWRVRTSLRRVAAELLGMPRHTDPGEEQALDPASHTATFDVAGRTVTTSRPALRGFEFVAPRPWGADQPRW